MLRAGIPRVKVEEAPRDGTLLGGSVAGGVPAAARLPRDTVLALERHGVAELRVGMAAAATEPGGRRGGAGGDRSWGASAARPPRRLSRRPARRPRAAWPQNRHHPQLCRCRQRRLRRQSRPRIASPSVKVNGLCSCRCCRLCLCLGVRIEPFASRVAISAVALLVVHVGVVPLAGGRGASHGGRRWAERGRARPSERAAPSWPTQGRWGSRTPSAIGGGTRGHGHNLQRGAAGGAAGWASEGCTAEGRGAAAAALPSLDDEVDDVGDGRAPAALPPGSGA